MIIQYVEHEKIALSRIDAATACHDFASLFPFNWNFCDCPLPTLCLGHSFYHCTNLLINIEKGYCVGAYFQLPIQTMFAVASRLTALAV